MASPDFFASWGLVYWGGAFVDFMADCSPGVICFTTYFANFCYSAAFERLKANCTLPAKLCNKIPQGRFKNVLK
jgi:hypothetical protein